MSSGVPLPNPSGMGPGTLAQAGDVGTATRRRHDALGGATGNVVIDLSPWGERGERVKNRVSEFHAFTEITQCRGKRARPTLHPLKTSPRASSTEKGWA